MPVTAEAIPRVGAKIRHVKQTLKQVPPRFVSFEVDTEACSNSEEVG